ncbi:MAG: YncE family protein [Steroidobacteraceae bacterium]
MRYVMARCGRAALLGFAAAMIGFAPPASARGTLTYRVVRSVALGAPERWDYAVYEPLSHRVFVAHGNRLTVIDGRGGRIVGQVGPIPGGPHGIAFDEKAGVGITDDGGRGLAVLFSLKSLRVLARLKIQRGADAVTFDPSSGHAFVIDGDTGSVAVIDPVRRAVVTTIHIGGDLEYAVPDGRGNLYVNGVTHHEVFRIDTANDRLTAAWPMPTCRGPHGLAIDTATHRLFASCSNGRLVVVNARDGVVVATLPIGRGTDADRFDARRRLIFSSNGMDGTLSVIREVNANTYEPLATVKTALSGRTMALDPRSGRVFIVAAHTTAQALQAFFAAWHAGKRPSSSPFTPGSLRVLFLDPVP